MTAHATVGVDDDLATGQACIRMRAARVRKPTGSVDDQAVIRRQQGGWNRNLDHLLANFLLDEGTLGFFAPVHVDERIVVLNRDHDRVHHGCCAFLVTHRHLRFSVRTRPREDVLLTDRGEAARQALRKRSSEGEKPTLEVVVGLSFVACIAKHEALIARALVGPKVVDALRNVRGLGGDVHVNVRQIGVRRIHANGMVGVADGFGGRTSKGFVIRCFAAQRNLASQDDDALVGRALDQGLHRNTGVRVHRQTGIDDGVGNGVAELVRVTRSYRFRREQLGGHGRCAESDAYEGSPRWEEPLRTMA